MKSVSSLIVPFVWLLVFFVHEKKNLEKNVHKSSMSFQFLPCNNSLLMFLFNVMKILLTKWENCIYKYHIDEQ